jgi:hypothetical protein
MTVANRALASKSWSSDLKGVFGVIEGGALFERSDSSPSRSQLNFTDAPETPPLEAPEV